MGSSGTLSGSGFGREIDEHSFVLRFSIAPLAGYERDVGSFTSMRVINNEMMRRGVSSGLVTEPHLSKLMLEGKLSPTKLLLKHPVLLPRFLTSLRPKSSCNKVPLETPILVLDSATVLTAIRQAFRTVTGSSAPQSMNFTSGIYVTIAMLRHCEHLDLYGFGLRPQNCNHYWDDPETCLNVTHALLDTNHRSTDHSYNVEKRFFDMLSSSVARTPSCIRVRG